MQTAPSGLPAHEYVRQSSPASFPLHGIPYEDPVGDQSMSTFRFDIIVNGSVPKHPRWDLSSPAGSLWMTRYDPFPGAQRTATSLR